jgi:hypothetical protein
MPRLGDFEFPATSLNATLASAKTLARELGREDVAKPDLAAVLNQLEVRISAAQLEALGLLEIEGERFRATKLTRRLAGRQSPNAYVMALIELCRRVPLFKLFLENALQYGIARTESDLFLLVARLTSAKREEVEAQIDTLWDQYRSFLAEIRSVLATPGRRLNIELALDARLNPGMRHGR